MGSASELLGPLPGSSATANAGAGADDSKGEALIDDKAKAGAEEQLSVTAAAFDALDKEFKDVMLCFFGCLLLIVFVC